MRGQYIFLVDSRFHGNDRVAESKPEKAPDTFLSLPNLHGGEGEEGRIPESFREHLGQETIVRMSAFLFFRENRD